MSYEQHTPHIDYSRYRFTAVLDWIRIEIRTMTRTNFQTLRRCCKLRYVKPLDMSSGGAANQFQFEIYDLTSWSSLRETVDMIEERFGLECAPKIIGIEISFDAYSRHDSIDDLVHMTAHLFKFIARPVSSNRRFVGKIQEGFDYSHQRTINHFRRGRTGYIGNKTDNVTQKAYFKTVDKKKPIQRSDYRARFEITMINEGCPFQTIDDAQNYNLAQLGQWFKFRRIDEDLEGLVRQVVDLKSVAGLVKPVRRAGGGVRLNARTTKADKVLGNKAYDALRYLDRKLKRNVRKSRFVISDSLR